MTARYTRRASTSRDGAITREGRAGVHSSVSALSSAAGHTALLESNDGALAEVYALEAGQLRKLTAHNDAFLAELELGAVEDIRFKSKDGTDIHGLMVKPPSFVAGRKYPTLLWIHGGPNGQDEHSLVLDGYQFEPQMFAAKGFVVLRVNYRGGSGRGARVRENHLRRLGPQGSRGSPGGGRLPGRAAVSPTRTGLQWVVGAMAAY